jgi:phage terminase large subunit GpA-like protein
MEYKRFIINAFEKKPGKWRACVQRPNGNPLHAKSRVRLDRFITGTDAASADAALRMAMEAIDAGSFSRSTTRSTEKFWRRTGTPARADRAETG